MRVLLALFLSMSIALGPLSNAARANGVDPNDMQTRVAKRAFLNDLRERVKIFMDQNVAYLMGLKLCLEGRPALMNCTEQLSIVRSNIKTQYPIMRKYLLLLNMLRPYSHAKLVQVYESQYDAYVQGEVSTAAIKIQDFIKPNPLEALWKIEYLPDVPFSNEEIRVAIEGESVMIEGTNYPEGLRGYESWYCELTFGVGHPGCKSMELEYLEETKSLRYAKRQLSQIWNGSDMLRIITDLADKSFTQQNDAAKRMKQKFYEIVQLNPYVALVSSATPSDNEILRAVTLMLGKAREVLAEYEIRMIKLSSPDVSDGELMRLLDYGPVAISVLNEPGENMKLVGFDYDSLYEEVSEQHMYDELWRTGGHIAIMIGVNALVCWGGGRVIKYLATARKVIKLRRWHEFFNPLCFSLTQIPINGWFIYDSVNYYHQSYKEVFSAADGEHFIREVNALSTAKRGIFWSIAMSPLGVGYVTKYAAGQSLKLSRPFLEHLSRIKH